MAIILDIGAGENPYFIRYGILWNKNDNYIYLDSSEKNLIKAKIKIEKYSLQKPLEDKISFLLEDAVNLSIESNTIETVVLSNVLSAPIHYNWDEQMNLLKINNYSKSFERKLLVNPSPNDIFYNERISLIKEVFRVLKPGGKLLIYTDLIIYGISAYNKILEDLKADYSFKVLADEQERINKLNTNKVFNKDYCYCFQAEVLPKCEVYEVIK